MPDNFSYISILNPGFTAATSISTTGKGGQFAYVSFLNPPSTAGGGGGGGSTIVGQTSYFANASNITFGSRGNTVTAYASYDHVPAPRSSAWGELGVWVGTGNPGAGVMYSQWLAGSSGYFMWMKIP